jgi:hypothetical protein
MEPYYALGSIEMRSDALAMPALEKHARRGGNVTESAVDGSSVNMILRVCSRAPRSFEP